jgi:hypothetical protein
LDKHLPPLRISKLMTLIQRRGNVSSEGVFI